MLKITSNVSVKTPVDQAFDYMVDPRNQVEWSPNFLSLDHLQPGPCGKGTRFRGTIKNFGLEYGRSSAHASSRW